MTDAADSKPEHEDEKGAVQPKAHPKKSPQEDPGAPGGTAGTGGTFRDQDR